MFRLVLISVLFYGCVVGLVILVIVLIILMVFGVGFRELVCYLLLFVLWLIFFVLY